MTDETKTRLEALAATLSTHAKHHDVPKDRHRKGLHEAYSHAYALVGEAIADLPEAPEPMSAEVERLTREMCELVYDSQPMAGDVEAIGMPLTRRLLALLDTPPKPEAIDIPPPTEPVQFSRPPTAMEIALVEYEEWECPTCKRTDHYVGEHGYDMCVHCDGLHPDDRDETKAVTDGRGPEVETPPTSADAAGVGGTSEWTRGSAMPPDLRATLDSMPATDSGRFASDAIIAAFINIAGPDSCAEFGIAWTDAAQRAYDVGIQHVSDIVRGKGLGLSELNAAPLQCGGVEMRGGVGVPSVTDDDRAAFERTVRTERSASDAPDPRRYVTHADLDDHARDLGRVERHAEENAAAIGRIHARVCTQEHGGASADDRLTALESGRFGVRAALRDWWVG